MKEGIPVSIVSIIVTCPDCAGFCESEKGTTIIVFNDTLLTCTSCRRKVKTPRIAFGKTFLHEFEIKNGQRFAIKEGPLKGERVTVTMDPTEIYTGTNEIFVTFDKAGQRVGSAILCPQMFYRDQLVEIDS